MAGSSVLFPWSSIALDSHLEFLPWTERHHPTGGDRNLFAGLRVAARPLVLLPQVEITEPGQLYLLATFQRFADDLEIGIHKFLRLTFVEAHFEEKALGHLRLGQRHVILATLPCMLSPMQTPRPLRIGRHQRQ